MLEHCNLKQNICLCSKQSSLFSFYALPSNGKSKDAVVHWQDNEHYLEGQNTAAGRSKALAIKGLVNADHSRVWIDDKVPVWIARQAVHDPPGIAGVAVRGFDDKNFCADGIVFVHDPRHGAGKNWRHVLNVVHGEEELAVDREVSVVDLKRQPIDLRVQYYKT